MSTPLPVTAIRDRAASRGITLGFRWWQPVMSVVVAAGVGTVTNLVTTTRTVPLVVALVTLVAIQSVAAWWQGRADLATARHRRNAALLPLRTAAPPQRARPLDWLSATVSPTPLWSGLRHKQLGELQRWCTDEADVFRIVSGPAGVGKTRLVIELATSLPVSWVAGRWTGMADVVERIAACPERALLVIDDADRTPGVVDLLSAAAKHRRQVRVVLLCRHGEGLATTLRRELPEQLRTLVDADPLELAPIGAGTDRQRWFDAAARRYAAAMKVSPPTLPDLSTAPPVGDDRDTMLILHARALLAVLNRHHTQTLGWPDVAQQLFSLEVAQWPTAGDHSEQTRTEVVLALCMVPARNTEEAAQMLRRLPRLRDATEQTVTELAEWARALYPPDTTDTLDLRPQLIAEWLIISHLDSYADLLDGLGDRAVQVLLSTLIRASTTFPETCSHLGLVIGKNPRRLVSAIKLVASAIPTRQLDETLSGLIDTTNLDYAGTLETTSAPTNFPRLLAALAALTVTRYRDLAAGNPDRYRHGVAHSLQDLANSLRDLGRSQDAVDADLEAVQIFCDLAASNPGHYGDDVAHSLHNLGGSLWKLGRPEQALDAIQEALQILRDLATGDPDRYRPDVAITLSLLGNLLRKLGRPQEALDADQEALGIRRDLAANNPDHHRPDIASSLHNLSASLFALARPQQALAASQEALDILRDLAANNPDHYRPDLAYSLQLLGVSRGALGQPRQALAATQEALDILRDLAANNPDHYRPDLAKSLHNLGVSLWKLGRPQQALAAAQKALGIRRGLAANNPDHYRPDLAKSLHNVGVSLWMLGRPQEALAATQEALDILRDLAANNPDHHRPDLADSLHNLGNSLWDLGRPQEALDAYQEALDILRDLAANNPDHHRPDLADSLHYVGNSLWDLGQRQEALAAWREQVQQLGRCARLDPARYEAHWRHANAQLRRRLEQSGNHIGAITAYLTYRPRETDV